MNERGGSVDGYQLPEDSESEFDERALEEAIRAHRRRELAVLAHLDS